MKNRKMIVALFFSALFSFSLSAQNVKITPLETYKKYTFVGAIEKNVYSYGGRDRETRAEIMVASKGGNVIAQTPMTLSMNNNHYKAEFYKVIGEHLIACYVIHDEKSGTPSLWIQQYDSKLKKLNEKKVTDLISGTIEAKQNLANFLLGVSKEKFIQKVTIDYNEVDDSYLVRYNYQVDKGEGLSYAKVVLLDGSFEEINEMMFSATDNNHIIVFEDIQMLANGDVVTVVKELAREKKGGRFNMLSKSSLMYFPRNEDQDPRFLELAPKEQRVLNSFIGKTLDDKGRLAYAIASKDEDGKSLDVNLYRYNAEKDELENTHIEFDNSEMKPSIWVKSNVDMKRFDLGGFQSLEDGSVYLNLNANYGSYTNKGDYYDIDRGVLAVKINADDEIEWQVYLDKVSKVRGTSGLSGAIDFVDASGNYNMIFNMSDDVYQKNQDILAGKTIKPRANEMFYTAKQQCVRHVTFDSTSGKVNLKSVQIPNVKGGAIYISRTEDFGDGTFLVSVLSKISIVQMLLKI